MCLYSCRTRRPGSLLLLRHMSRGFPAIVFPRETNSVAVRQQSDLTQRSRRAKNEAQGHQPVT
jgi:hypothetical protein